MADKVSMAEFEKRLADGRYDSLTGARRGIGKMAGWSEKERALANEKANAYFEKGAKKAAPKKAKVAPKKAKAKAEKVKAKAPAQAKAPATRAPRAVSSAPVQAELPFDTEVAKANVSIKRSEALKGILENAERTRALGGTDADIKRIAAAASKDLIDTINNLLGTTHEVVKQVKEAGDNGSSKIDTSVADAALAAAAENAKRAVAKGGSMPVIPPLMGRQG
jgi:gas vesicle protein